jgi:prevent-host-death family protein
MPRVRPSRDIRPLTEFRANVAQFVQQVQDTGRPMILTQHGRSAAVLMDVEAYEGLLDQLALVRDVQAAELEIAAGRGIAQGSAAKMLRASLTK